LLVALAAVAASLAGSAVANAAISGTVVNTAGVPLGGISVEARNAGGLFVDSATTDGAGAFNLSSAGGTASLHLSEYDNCRDYSDPKYHPTVDVPASDPQSGVQVTIDIYDFCVGSTFAPDPDPTGVVDGVARRIVLPLGGIAYVKPQGVPFSATNLQITLANGTVISSPSATSSSILKVNGPATPYNGPLLLTFNDGAARSRSLGTLVVQAFTTTGPSSGVPYDVEAIVDVSGSMAGTDPTNLRRDALNLLADLSGTADGLGAVGFDSGFKPIADLKQMATQAAVNAFKAAVKAKVGNFGSTDYNVGMDQAWAALNAPGVDLNKPKLVVFLTDGAHNAGAYNNGHLRFAAPGVFNGVTQRSWPVCVVQLGKPATFNAVDVARLRRIASETGGRYFATQTSAKLTDIYFQCRGQGTGQQSLLSKRAVFTKAGQQRVFRRALRKGLKQATFFVSSGGTFRFTFGLRDPRGRLHTSAVPGKNIVFRRGGTFAFFRVTKPAKGTWTIVIRATKILSTTGQGQVTISVPRR
jgi:hypothetical protein